MKKIKFILFFTLFIGLFYFFFTTMYKANPSGSYVYYADTQSESAPHDPYLTLNEIKDGVAMLRIKNNGQHLVQTGDIIDVDRETHFLFGTTLLGEVKVKEVTDTSLEADVTINTTNGFLAESLIIAGLGAFIFSYIFVFGVTGMRNEMKSKKMNNTDLAS